VGKSRNLGRCVAGRPGNNWRKGCRCCPTWSLGRDPGAARWQPSWCPRPCHTFLLSGPVYHPRPSYSYRNVLGPGSLRGGEPALHRRRNLARFAGLALSHVLRQGRPGGASGALYSYRYAILTATYKITELLVGPEGALCAVACRTVSHPAGRPAAPPYDPPLYVHAP